MDSADLFEREAEESGEDLPSESSEEEDKEGWFLPHVHYRHLISCDAMRSYAIHRHREVGACFVKTDLLSAIFRFLSDVFTCEGSL